MERIHINRICTLLSILTVSGIFACERAPEELFQRRFTIRKGHHYASPRVFEMLQANSLAADITFDESAIYDLHDPALQTNKNKLIGFSDCNSAHHKNSARFAWQWCNNALEIYAYCYVDNVRIEQFLGTVKINKTDRYELVLEGKSYKFYLNGELKAVVGRSNQVCDIGVYYLLFPYFGGEVGAPHTITITIAMKY